jgi:hypothetical protein
LKKLFFSLIVLFSISIFVPMSFGELYYNDQYAFSIEYPEGWKITGGQDMINEGVFFSDGTEQALVGTWGLWNSMASVYVEPDYGSYGGQNEEKKMQREWYQDLCNDISTCTDFRVISHTVGTTAEGYPTLTLKYSETNTYPGLSGKYPMINYAKHVYVGTDLWTIDVQTDKDDFSKYQGAIFVLLDSFKIPASPPSGGGCLIATATYGSELAPQVQQLRELRDNQLLQTESGTAFMGTFNDIYYTFSPTIADMERENPYFKEAVKIAITPMISSLSLMENANSESEVLSIGISVIMLNLGMYLGVPAVVIVGIRKRF